MDKLKPRDHAEQVALFRSEIIGQLTRRELDRGELRAELRALSKKRFRPPKAKHTRKYAVSTLERWYYAYKRGGLDALRPQTRSDQGYARSLTEAQRELLLDIRREHRSASAPLILRTLVAEGRLQEGEVSPATIRRLYQQAGLTRVAMRDGDSPKSRLRWQAARPGVLWHADVCHGSPIITGGNKQRVCIHALLDDASRYVLALQALPTEREIDMLHIFTRVLRRHGSPDVLYLDNGPLYVGEALKLCCERLGITLLHAAPYDPQARGKIERFFRTLRQQCLRFMSDMASLHDVNVRLWAWLDMHYHRAPHASLFGRTPGDVWAEAEHERSQETDRLDEATLRHALTVRERRRVRRDSTLDVAGKTFQLDQGFLAGKVVTAAYCLLDEPVDPVVEIDDNQYPLHLVDPVKNAKTRRTTRPDTADKPKTHFNPPDALLRKATGRRREEDVT